MAITSGFFNSVNGDRKYNADQMSEFYTGIANDGVFQHIDNGLAVSAGTGLTVNVATGRALIQKKWVKNDAVLTKTISAASATYARIDAVVIRFSKSNRNISIVVKDGTPAASPAAPSLTRNSDVYEMALAYVNVAANATSVTVTDKRSDTTVCGWVSVAQQTSGEVDAMLNAMKTGFDGVEYQTPVAMVQGCDQKLQDQIDIVTDYIHLSSYNLLNATAAVYSYNFKSGWYYKITNGNAVTTFNLRLNGDVVQTFINLSANETRIFQANQNADAIAFYAQGNMTVLLVEISPDEYAKEDGITNAIGVINGLKEKYYSVKNGTKLTAPYTFNIGEVYRVINGNATTTFNLTSGTTVVQSFPNLSANESRFITITANADAINFYALADIPVVLIPYITYQADGSVTTAKIADGAVTQAKLDPSIHLSLDDGEVTTAKIANNAVTLGKLAPEVDSKYTNGANITGGTIPKSALTEALIQFIETAGGGTITNYPDDNSIKANGDNELYVNPGAFNVVAITEDMTYSDAITMISAVSGKVILLMGADITGFPSSTNFPSNVAVVVGLGGIFDTTRLGDTYIYFAEGCRFICGNYRLFNDYIMAKCSSGYLDGEAKPIWWGGVADGETSVTTNFNRMNLSDFKVIRFTPGLYIGYFNNTKDGRTLIFDEGAIIDGVIHVAYGSSLGAETKRWCKNTKVIGKCVSTVRVGGAQIDGLSMPDGIEILGVNADYPNQTTEGGPKGVHWHFGCKNLNIGEIKVTSVGVPAAGYAYALGVDGETGEESPHDIHVERVVSGANTSAWFDVLLSSVKNITIGEIIAESGTGLSSSVGVMGSCENIKIGHIFTKFAGTTQGKCSVQLSGSRIYVDNIEMLPDVNSAYTSFGLFINSAQNVYVGNVHSKYAAQGIRLVNATNTLIVNHTSESDTQAKAASSSTYEILNEFTS